MDLAVPPRQLKPAGLSELDVFWLKRCEGSSSWSTAAQEAYTTESGAWSPAAQERCPTEVHASVTTKMYSQNVPEGSGRRG
eukprot:364195-Chlamydomonas_euryale.AAC.1